MNILHVLGTTCTGIVVGWLIRYFIRRFDNYSPKVITSVISVIFGGVIIKFVETDNSTFWFYPIGLFVGFIFYSAQAIYVKKSSIDKDDGTFYDSN